MNEVWVRKGNVVKKVHENIASEYKLIGWKILTEKEAKEFYTEPKTRISEKEVKTLKVEE